MSFFIRKRGGGHSNPSSGKLTDRAGGGNKRKYPTGGNASRGRQSRPRGGKYPKQDRRAPREDISKRPGGDDEITSESEDEEEPEVNQNEDLESDHSETEQEARIRIAKEQIAELKKKLKTDDENAVSELLRDNALEEHGKVLRKVAVHLEGKELEVQTILSGKVIKTPVTSVVCSSNLVYCSTKSGVIVRLNRKSSIPRQSTNLKTRINCIAVRDRYLAVSTPKSILLLDSSTLNLLHTYANSRDSSTLCINNDTLFSTHKDRTIKLWSLKERAYVESLFGHQDVPTSVTCHESSIVSAGGFDGSLRYWKLETDSQLVYNFNEIVEVVGMLNERFFVAGGINGTLGLFSTGRKKPLSFVSNSHGIRNGVANWVTCVGGFGDMLVSGSDTGVIKIWKVVNRSLEFMRDVEVGDGVVVGVHVVIEEEQDKMVIVVGLSTEHPRGRWGGRKANCSRILVLSCKT